MYVTLFLIGILGLVVMTLLGAGHGAHSGHAAHAGSHCGHGHAAVGGSHGHQGPHGGAARAGARSTGQTGARGLAGVGMVVLGLLSPSVLFSLCFGAGATGLILSARHYPGTMVAVGAVVGAVLFNGLLVTPMRNLIFRFASKPSGALDAAVSQTAEAASRFDATGKGIVNVNVDGQTVRVLATLEGDEVGTSSTILPGDTLTITAVDSRTNRCRVARL